MTGPVRDVALLRGVNVGGVTIRSADLAAMFRGLGFADVRTVLASGNVVFASGEADRAGLKARIERALGERFGYTAWIVLTDTAHLARVVEAFPWPERDDHQPWVIFASDASALDELEAADRDPERDRLARGEGVLYWETPKGSSTDTPFAKALARRRYQATTTNRNLRTLRRLLP